MLVLAFDTATDVATSALVDDGRVLGERVGIARNVLADVDALLSAAGLRPWTSTRSSSAPARGASRARESASRSRAVSRSRSTFPERACRRWRRSGRRPEALSGHRRAATRGVRRGAACRRAGRPRARAGNGLHRKRRGSLPRRRSRARARSSRRTTTHGTSRTLASTRRSRPTSGRSTRSSRSTCALPTRRRRSRERRAAAPRAGRSRRRRGDRARVVSDAVVALDVRRRAPQAELARARRVRTRTACSSGTRSSRATSTRGT